MCFYHWKFGISAGHEAYKSNVWFYDGDMDSETHPMP